MAIFNWLALTFLLMVTFELMSRHRVTAMTLPRILWLLPRSSICKGLRQNRTGLAMIGLIGDGDGSALMLLNERMQLSIAPRWSLSTANASEPKLFLEDAFEQEPRDVVTGWSSLPFKGFALNPVRNAYLLNNDSNSNGNTTTSLVMHTMDRKYVLPVNSTSAKKMTYKVKEHKPGLVIISHRRHHGTLVDRLVTTQDRVCLLGHGGAGVKNCINTNSSVTCGAVLESSQELLLVFQNHSLALLKIENATSLQVNIIWTARDPGTFYVCNSADRTMAMVLICALVGTLLILVVVLIFAIVYCILSLTQKSGRMPAGLLDLQKQLQGKKDGSNSLTRDYQAKSSSSPSTKVKKRKKKSGEKKSATTTTKSTSTSSTKK